MTSETSRERFIRLYTPWGLILGSLACPERMRTLDELNVVAKEFVTVGNPETTGGSWEITDGDLALHKSSILFVHECGSPPALTEGDFGRFARASVRLKVDDFTLHGFVHVPPGGSPMKRFENQRHPFLALTSVLVAGNDVEIVVPFLAVNRQRIAAIQQVARPEGEADRTVEASDAALASDPG